MSKDETEEEEKRKRGGKEKEKRVCSATLFPLLLRG